MSNAIFINRCFEFIFQTSILQVQCADSSSATQFHSRQGSGKIRHLSGKILWVRAKVQGNEVVTLLNLGDIGTKPLSRKPLRAFMGETGMICVESGEAVGAPERIELQEQASSSRSLVS